MMNENKEQAPQSSTKRSFLVKLTLLTLIFGIGGGVLLHTCFPGHYFTLYPIVPIFFYLSGWMTITLFEFFRQRMPSRLLMLYLGIRVFRMLFTLILILVYCIVCRESVRAFMLSVVLFYLFYLSYETCFFFKHELKGSIQRKENK